MGHSQSFLIGIGTTVYELIALNEHQALTIFYSPVAVTVNIPVITGAIGNAGISRVRANALM